MKGAGGHLQATSSETTTVQFHPRALQLKMRIFKIPTEVLNVWTGSLQLNQCSVTKLRVQLIHPHFQKSSETSHVSINLFSPGRLNDTVLCTWACLYTKISMFPHCWFNPWVASSLLLITFLTLCLKRAEISVSLNKWERITHNVFLSFRLIDP